MIEKKQELCIYRKEKILNDEIRTLVNSASNYNEQVEIINDNYLLVKGDLNAQYGNNAQHLLRYDYFYNKETKEYFKTLDENSYFETKQKTSYIYGLYVPQYAQASILYICYQFIKNNIDIYYIDTDSIKTNDTRKANDIVRDYNKLIKSYENETTKLYGFGLLEKEFVADKFCSLGSKTYLIYKEKVKNDE